LENYFDFANGSTLFWLCVPVIVCAVVQALLFLRKAWRRGLELGMTKGEMKKVITSSAVFSIVPSLPIVVMMMMLIPVLGKYIPWMRLSVIGSGTYEYMAADFTVKAAGLSGLTDPGMNMNIFITIVWAMTLGILVGPLFIVLFFKSYDKGLKTLSGKKNSFMPFLINATFFGMLSVFIAPIAMDVSAPLGILTFLCAGIAAMIMNFAAKKTGVKTIRDFSFPLSMLTGMICAVLLQFVL